MFNAGFMRQILLNIQNLSQTNQPQSTKQNRRSGYQRVDEIGLSHRWMPRALLSGFGHAAAKDLREGGPLRPGLKETRRVGK